MYLDILFINYIYKTNMSLCIFDGITAYNKSFYIGFVFLRYKDNNSYNWILSQIHELYTYIGQEKEPQVILIDNKDAFITSLKEVIFSSHYMLYIWHINKNIIARAIKYFSDPEQLKD